MVSGMGEGRAEGGSIYHTSSLTQEGGRGRAMGAGEKEEQEGQGGKEGGRGVLITPHYSLKKGEGEGECLSHFITH